MFTGINLYCFLYLLGALVVQLPRIISLTSLTGVYYRESKGLNKFTTNVFKYLIDMYAYLFIFYLFALIIVTLAFVTLVIVNHSYLSLLGYLSVILTLVIVYVSTLSMFNFDTNSYSFAEKTTSKLVEKINYTDLKKYYSESVSSSISKLYIKGITQYYQEAKTEFQRDVLNVARVVINNKDVDSAKELIENILKEAKYVNLISSVINLIEDERLYKFIITTDEGAETVKSLSKQLKELELTIQNQTESANRIKNTIDTSEIIMEIESLTASSIKTS